MFHPVGSQPPNVYWRRRLLVLGSTVIVLVLMVVTVSALMPAGSSSPASAGGPSSTPVADRTSQPSTSRHPSTTPSDRPRHNSSKTGSSKTHSSTSPATPGSPTGTATVASCRSSDLSVTAVAGQTNYRVGAEPKVELQVTNVGSAPCVQDLADKQILLKVYNGVSRVWGSHDCEIQPGVNKHILAVGAPVRVSVTWSGETSQPRCKGTRQQVGAGTYTLYATLSGKRGKAAQFTIS